MSRYGLSLAAACVLLLAACAPREDRSDLYRHPVSPATASGWARLPLDGATQKAYPELWLSDAEGTSIPFEVEREGLWQPRQLELSRQILGRDTQGRPTAEFSLKFPDGWQVREREHLKVALTLEGKAPWVCQVQVERRMEASSYIRLEQDPVLHLFDLGPGQDRTTFYIPWDAQTYRLTLIPTQGEAPSISQVTVTASTRPEELQADEIVTPQVEKIANTSGEETWLLKLDSPQRIVGADLQLKAPIAPISPQFQEPPRDSAPSSRNESVVLVMSEGLVWNLPALNTKATRVAVGPLVTDRLKLVLPAQVSLEGIKLMVRREVLLFPAEAQKPYFVHRGGQVKRAPGSLAALPESSRAVYTRAPLSLGPAEPDSQGIPSVVKASDRARPWLPWVAGLAVLLLGASAWKLLMGAPRPEA